MFYTVITGISELGKNYKGQKWAAIHSGQYLTLTHAFEEKHMHGCKPTGMSPKGKKKGGDLSCPPVLQLNKEMVELNGVLHS